MPLLELDDFGVDIGGGARLDGLSFKLARAQSVSIAGAAGAGKSLLALALGGMLPRNATTRGTLTLDGNPLPADGAAMARIRGRRIGLMFGDGRAALDPVQTVGAQLAALLRRLAQPAEDKDVIALMAECGLAEPVARSFPNALDPGAQRHVMLALALAGNPDLLIADEPADGLDPVATRALYDLIPGIARRRGLALLMMARDLRAVAAVTNEVMILDRGRIVETGTPSQTFARPQHEATRALVEASKMKTRTLARNPIGTDLLTVRDLRLTPQSPGIDFVVRRAETLAIVGRPGSGKSRIARIVAGLDRAPSGLLAYEHDTYRGHDLPHHRRREIALAFADPRAAFNPRLPVGTSLHEPLHLEPHLLVEEQAARLVEVVRAVGIPPDRLEALPPSFSYDELGRLALARALIARPRLLILDDPVAGLDPLQRAERLVLITRLRSDYGLTCLVFLDDIEVARVLGDRALILDGGRIAEEGKPADLIDAPRHPLTEALVAARLPEVGALPTLQP